MLLSNRIIYSDNGVLSDLSVNLNDYKAGTEAVTVTASEDCIFIGSEFPFNHRYISIDGVGNAQASVVSVELWDGRNFNPAVDIIDQTAVAGATLSKSGHISWVMDKDNIGWVRDDTTRSNGSESITGLGTLTIYDLYWAKLSFSADLDAVSFKFSGQRFSDDVDLATYYPELLLTNTLCSFEASKTNWDDQHFEAASIVARDLRRKGVVFSVNQILDWEILKEAAVHKVAEVVFNAFGDDFRDNRNQARIDYQSSLDIDLFNVDRNMNTRIDPNERVLRQGKLTR